LQISSFDGRDLPALLHHQAKIAIADFSIQYSPHGIALRGPEMQQAFVVFA
jgi:hypothetical protein